MSDRSELDDLAAAWGQVREPGDHSPLCHDDEPCRYCVADIDRLLASPAFARLLDQARADALREAADEVVRMAQGLPPGYSPADDSVPEWLRDRADEIDPGARSRDAVEGMRTWGAP